MSGDKSVWARIQERHESGRSAVEEAAAGGDPYAQQVMRLREATTIGDEARRDGVTLDPAKSVVRALRGGEAWADWVEQAQQAVQDGRARA